MKILIVGGTGYVGQKLGQRLAQDGHSLSVTSRRPSEAEIQLSYPAQVLNWEAWLAGQGGDFAVVINLAGEGIADQRWTESRKLKLRDSRVELTRRLTERIRRQTVQPQVWIQASAIGIYGDRANEWLYEEGELGSGFLAQLCKDWEDALPSGVAKRQAVLRIGVVIGRGSGFLRALEPIWQIGGGGVLGSGRQWLSWIHIHDLVELIRKAVSDDRCSGVFNAVSPEPLKNVDVTKELASAMKVTAVAPAPEFAIRLAFGEMAEAVLGSQRVSAQKLIHCGFEFRYPTLRGALGQVYDGIESGESLVEWEKWLPLKPAELFPFFANETNLEKITPDFLSFRVFKKSTPQIERDTLIDYRLKIHGVPVGWRTRIEEWRPPFEFVDTQVKGPYKKWHHTHQFQELAGGTLMRDLVRYKVPLGWLGRATAGWLVRKDVEAIFSYRQKTIHSQFSGRNHRMNRD